VVKHVFVLATLLAAAAIPLPALAAPPPVVAHYFFDGDAASLKTDAYNFGRAFAQHHPGGNRLLLLDFGGARKLSADTYGAQSFHSGTVIFSNAQILAALESASDGVHNGYTGVGSTIVAYGNSNSSMTSHGMTAGDAWNAGFYQSQRAQDLAGYQSAHGYGRQSVAIAQDQEPAFDKPAISRSLADGAAAQGYALDYDYGSADGCYPYNGGSGEGCANGWTTGDVVHVSYGAASAVPLPEIYYASPDQSAQWTHIRKADPSLGYTFFGTTGEAGAPLTPAGGWNRLAAANPGLVLNELVCFGC
jgi:hypothetical protein